jgi:phosphoglycolate phosphatase
MIRHIVWDWNGTLLDDVDSCVDTLNVLRAERRLPAIGKGEYRARFGFPVKAFYEQIGFDFAAEDFAALSRDFHAGYRARWGEMRLQPGVRELLGGLGGQGIAHLVISAMESRLLGEMLAVHELDPLLTGYHGRADLSGESKVELGAAAVRGRGLDPAEVLVVGDTLHDHELARAIGCRSVLYAGGHQDRARLAAAGTAVTDSLSEIVRFVTGEAPLSLPV